MGVVPGDVSRTAGVDLRNRRQLQLFGFTGILEKKRRGRDEQRPSDYVSGELKRWGCSRLKSRLPGKFLLVARRPTAGREVRREIWRKDELGREDAKPLSWH